MQTFGRAINGIINFFGSMLSLVLECFKLKWQGGDTYENIVALLKGALVLIPIIVAIITCSTYYSTHTFVPAVGSVINFGPVSTYFTFNLVFSGCALVAIIVFLVLLRRGPDWAISAKLAVFNLVLLPVLVFCIVNLYFLIALIVLIILIFILSKFVFKIKREDKPTKKEKRDVTKELPEPLDGRVFTENEYGNIIRVKNAYRLQIRRTRDRELVISTNSFGQAPIDLGPVDMFKTGELQLIDERNNPIDLNKIRRF